MISVKNSQRGFSLIELMTVSATVGFVMAGFWQLTVFQASYQDEMQDRLTSTATTTIITKKIIEDIETAGYGIPLVPTFGKVSVLDDEALANQIALTTLDGANTHVLTAARLTRMYWTRWLLRGFRLLWILTSLSCHQHYLMVRSFASVA